MADFGDPRLPARFWDKVRVCSKTGCWLWQAYTNFHGYGTFRASKVRLAHRHAYLTLVGDTSLGLDHLCRERSCVNPAHLEPVTQQENILRGLLPLAQTLKHAAMTHCRRGHEHSEANTLLKKRGKYVGRDCRVCTRLRRAARLQARAA